MRPVFPQRLLGTDAFTSCCIHPESDVYRWVWDQRARNLHARGLVVSAATIEQVYSHVRTLAASKSRDDLDEAKNLQNSIDKVATLFRQKGCILPITDELLVYAHTSLDFTIEYYRRGNAKQNLGILEKIVLATAIVGFRDQPLWLVEYEQPDAFPRLQRDYGLRVQTFPHAPGNRRQGFAS